MKSAHSMNAAPGGDDRFLRRAKKFSDLKTEVVTPLELIEELNI